MNLQQKTESGKKLKRYISASRIQKRVKKLAGKISKDYKARSANGRVPVLIGVLNGSFIFFSDLARAIKLDIEIDFIKLSSYGESKISSGQVKLLKELNCAIEGKDIIVVEDIVDSGVSLRYIRDLILKNNPASLEFAALLYKKDAGNIDFDVKYIGFKIPNKFVVGYGLDFAQKYRNLKEIYILKTNLQIL